MDPKESFYIPSHLDDPPRFFFWDMDVGLTFAGAAGFIAIMGAPMVGLLVGGIAGYWLSRVKAGEGRGFFFALLYWYLPTGKLNIRSRRLPPSWIREFTG